MWISCKLLIYWFANASYFHSKTESHLCVHIQTKNYSHRSHFNCSANININRWTTTCVFLSIIKWVAQVVIAAILEYGFCFQMKPTLIVCLYATHLPLSLFSVGHSVTRHTTLKKNPFIGRHRSISGQTLSTRSASINIFPVQFTSIPPTFTDCSWKSI